MKENTGKYFKNLDGLRSVAFIMVFFYHAFLYFVPNAISQNTLYSYLFKIITLNEQAGHIGVSFFFVLSGFLITYLLIQEKENKGKIHILKFYGRRVFRIWPVYYVSLILAFLVFPKLLNMFDITIAETASVPLNYILFLANFDIILNGYPSPILGVHWSVCIEEQYYLLWPLILYFAHKKKWLYLFCFVFIISSFLFTLTSTHIHRQYHTLTALNYLSFGGLMAGLSYYQNKKLLLVLNSWPKYIHAILYILFIFFVFSHKSIFQTLQISYQYSKPFVNIIYALFFSYVILEQNFAKFSFYKISSFIFLTKTSKYTYALYLLHMFSIIMVKAILLKTETEITFVNLFVWIFLSLIISYVFAYLTYVILEKRFATWKNKYLQP